MDENRLVVTNILFKERHDENPPAIKAIVPSFCRLALKFSHRRLLIGGSRSTFQAASNPRAEPDVASGGVVPARASTLTFRVSSRGRGFIDV